MPQASFRVQGKVADAFSDLLLKINVSKPKFLAGIHKGLTGGVMGRFLNACIFHHAVEVGSHAGGSPTLGSAVFPLHKIRIWRTQKRTIIVVGAAA